MRTKTPNKRSKTDLKGTVHNNLQNEGGKIKGTAEKVILKKKKNTSTKKIFQGKKSNSFNTTGSKKVLNLKSKCKNKVKTLVQPYNKLLPEDNNKMTYSELKGMIKGLVGANAQSPYPSGNPKLYQVILKALKEEVPWSLIESILQECTQKAKIDKNYFHLQLIMEKKIFIVLGLRSNNLLKLKRNLLPILKKYSCSKEPVLEYFKWNCKIEALAPYPTTLYFADFETSLSKDAVSIKAEGIEIKDYETGAVCFQGHPLELSCMVDQLEQKNYKVLFTRHGFEAIEKLTLDCKERQRYKMFLYELLTFKEIETLYDNTVETESDSEINKIKAN